MLLKLHKLRSDYQGAVVTYSKGEPIWINPAFVVAVMAWSHKGTTGAELRLHGDETHQDWTKVWEPQATVAAALQARPPEADEAS